MNKDLNFKIYLKENEQDIKSTLNNIPKNHVKLLKNFKIKYTCNNTLDFDKKHVGIIKNKKITVCAPWNYSRQFTTLHEIAHLVWCKILDKKNKEEWKKIIKQTGNKTKEKDPEELFCMAYANYYSSHKLTTYRDKEWEKFIQSVSLM
jgi:hypothetical protein